MKLTYDPLGRMFSASSPSAGTTRFHYEGDDLVAEYDSNNSLLRRYVHGPGNYVVNSVEKLLLASLTIV